MQNQILKSPYQVIWLSRISFAFKLRAVAAETRKAFEALKSRCAFKIDVSSNITISIIEKKEVKYAVALIQKSYQSLFRRLGFFVWKLCALKFRGNYLFSAIKRSQKTVIICTLWGWIECSHIATGECICFASSYLLSLGHFMFLSQPFSLALAVIPFLPSKFVYFSFAKYVRALLLWAHHIPFVHFFVVHIERSGDVVMTTLYMCNFG